MQELPGGPARRLRHGLADRHGISSRRHVVAAFDLQAGCPGLRIPQPELREVDARGVLHRLHEILAGDRLAVVARDVEIHAPAERRPADEGVQHADDLGTLVVDGRGVEVVHLDIGVRTHRMRHRARILRELGGTQALHLGDAALRRRPHVG